jgi:hypothetical protein
VERGRKGVRREEKGSEGQERQESKTDERRGERERGQAAPFILGQAYLAPAR